MKILLIHNTYQQKGGEDSVFENEYKLLNEKNIVEKLLFNNNDIKSPLDKLKVGFNSIYNKNSAKIVKEKIEEFNPDIIHVHNFFPVASPSIFYSANQFNIPIVMTLHNYRLICPNALLFHNNKICEKCINKSFAINGVLNGCYRESKVQTFALAFMSYIHKKRKTWNNRVDKYIALTNFAKDKILNSSLNLDKNQIIVKPNFVEDNGFDYDKEEYFLFIGRLSIEKGIELLLRSFENSNKKLLIIGGGPLETIVKESVKKNTNIKYLGFQNKKFIIDKLKKAKALIFTSIWYEGMPMTILESFSTGTPVIAPNIGGPNEIVKDYINGLIYKANNLNSLSTKIDMLASNSNIHKQLCLEARNFYEQKYSVKKNYEFLINIYKEVISDEKKENN